MKKVEQFYAQTEEDDVQCYKHAVGVVGLQPGPRRVWVLNRDVHFENGKFLTPEQSPYSWVKASGLPPRDMECCVPTSATRPR